MNKTDKIAAKPVVAVNKSVNLSLNTASDSALVSLVERLVAERSDSMRISLRTSASAMLSLMNKIGRHATEVSAVLTLKGSGRAV